MERPVGNTDAWETLLSQKRAERRQELNERRMQEEIAEAERKRHLEESRRLAEERRLQRIADEQAQKADDIRRTAEASQRAEEERQASIETERTERREVLEKAAKTKFIKQPNHCELWLTTGNQKLRSSVAMAPRPIELAAESKEGLEKALALLKSIKF